jgi:SM-20-related protein
MSGSAINFEALAAANLAPEPYPHLYVPNFIRSEVLARLEVEYPAINVPGSVPPGAVVLTSAFRNFLDELEGPALRDAIASKVDLDLAGRPTLLTLRGQLSGKEGKIHTDSKSKLVTVLIYFNHVWQQTGGRLRVLRSASNLDEYSLEVPPLSGHMLIFRVGECSWHGHYPAHGPRRAIQLNWVTDSGVARRERTRHFLSVGVKRLTRWAS